MNLNPLPERARPITIELSEWDHIGPAEDSRLRGFSLGGETKRRQLIETLRGRVDIRQGYDGLEITSSSFVGRIDVGPLRVVITPKAACYAVGTPFTLCLWAARRYRD